MSVPDNRCGFTLDPAEVADRLERVADESGHEHYESYDRPDAIREESESDWYEEYESVCCYRETWNDTDRCIWHAEIEEKPAVELVDVWQDEDDGSDRQVRLDGAFLRGVDLEDSLIFEGCRLDAGDFTNANLRGTKFHDSILVLSQFAHADLADTKYQVVNLRDAELPETNLHRTEFCDTSLPDAEFPGSSLHRAEFSDSFLQDVAFPDADLYKAKFSDADLQRVEFTNASMQDVAFPNTNLRGARFLDTDLYRANFLDVDLQKAKFSQADLHRAKFLNADLKMVNFANTSLRYTKLINTQLYRAEFSDTNLHFAKFRKTNLRHTAFSNADLRDATFLDVDLHDATFHNVDLRHTEFPSTYLKSVKFRESNLHHAKFLNADLRDASFPNTNLSHADFTASNLEGASLSGSDLSGADFVDAKLHDADLLDVRINEETAFVELDGESDSDSRCFYEKEANRYTPPDVRSRLTKSADRAGRLAHYLEATTAMPSESLPETIPVDDWDASDNRGILSRVKSLFTSTYRTYRRWRFWRKNDGQAHDYARENLEKATTMYRTYQRLHRENDIVGEEIPHYYVREKEVRRKRAILNGDLFDWLNRAGQRWAMLYGESPWRIVAASVAIVALFGFLYPLLGGVSIETTGPTHEWFVPPTFGGVLPHAVSDLLVNLYFSAVTFTTLGYGGMQPAHPLTQFLAAVESLVGAMLIALLVAVLARRVTR